MMMELIIIILKNTDYEKIVLFFLLNIVIFRVFCQEIIDQVVAIVGENPILIQKFKDKNCSYFNKELN